MMDMVGCGPGCMQTPTRAQQQLFCALCMQAVLLGGNFEVCGECMHMKATYAKPAPTEWDKLGFGLENVAACPRDVCCLARVYCKRRPMHAYMHACMHADMPACCRVRRACTLPPGARRQVGPQAPLHPMAPSR
eukprot:356995-Chlamydomonas_euryale.AAC.11